MKEELKILIGELGYNSNTDINIIRSFINTGINGDLYRSIKGDNFDEKIETVKEYLLELEFENTTPNEKPKLNLIIADNSSSLEYVAFLNLKYNVTVHKIDDIINPKDIKNIDLVLFTGGEDINPAIYKENLGKYTYCNSKRDEIEISTFNKFRGLIPMLGVCRGSQMLTSLVGGKLIQHVSGHGKDHTMIVNGNMRYRITSSHHQMLFPFNLPKKEYELIAYSEYFQSNTYLNGDNEEIELPVDFLEPEIVFYNKYNALCIQGHPEWSHCEKRTTNMCLNLIDKYLIKSKKELVNLEPSSNTFKRIYEKNMAYFEKKYAPISNEEEEYEEFVKEEDSFWDEFVKEEEEN